MKRGYFAYCGDDEMGLAVVAGSAQEAKRIAWRDTFDLDNDWIDVRARWVKGADVSDLPIGVVQDARVALLRGLYGSIMEYPCDECGKDADVICHHGRALCSCCIEQSIREARDGCASLPEP